MPTATANSTGSTEKVIEQRLGEVANTEQEGEEAGQKYHRYLFFRWEGAIARVGGSGTEGNELHVVKHLEASSEVTPPGLAGRCRFWRLHLVLALRVFRLEVSAFVNDAVDVEGFADHLVHDAVGVHPDFAHAGLADLRDNAAQARQGQKRFHLVGDVLNDASGVALRVVGDVLVNQTQVFASWLRPDNHH